MKSLKQHISEKLVISPSHVSEKLVINKDYNDITYHNSKVLYELEFLWDDQFYKRVMYVYVHDVDEIKAEKNNLVLLGFADNRMWQRSKIGIHAKCDDGLQIFYRKTFTQDGDMANIYFGEQYTEQFKDLCNNFLKGKERCTAQEIFKYLKLNFRGDIEKTIDAITENDKDFYIVENKLTEAIIKLREYDATIKIR